jgi:hypothetical protein
MKKILFLIFAAGILFSACDLYEAPVADADKDAIFSSEAGLKTYSYSFYNMMPSASDLNQIEIDLVDFGAINNLNTFITKNAYSETNSSGWSSKDDWSKLRNINYFIANCTDESIPENVRNHYIGLARFFQGLFLL